MHSSVYLLAASLHPMMYLCIECMLYIRTLPPPMLYIHTLPLPSLYSGDNLIDEEELLELSYSAYEAGNYSPTLLKPSDLEDTVS